MKLVDMHGIITNILFILMFSIIIIEKRKLMKSAARSPACRCRGAAVLISKSAERAAAARSGAPARQMDG